MTINRKRRSFKHEIPLHPLEFYGEIPVSFKAWSPVCAKCGEKAVEYIGRYKTSNSRECRVDIYHTGCWEKAENGLVFGQKKEG